MRNQSDNAFNQHAATESIHSLNSDVTLDVTSSIITMDETEFITEENHTTPIYDCEGAMEDYYERPQRHLAGDEHIYTRHIPE